MMEDYTWYQIINRGEFLDTGLYSRNLVLNLQGLGEREITVTRGVGFGLVFDGVFLRMSLNDRNPYYFDGYAIALDENDDIYLGILNED